VDPRWRGEVGDEVGHLDGDLGDVQAGQLGDPVPYSFPDRLRNGGHRAGPADADRQVNENDAAIDVGSGLREIGEAGCA
jgi:hypothetical protein